MKSNKKNLKFWIVLFACVIAVVQLFCTFFEADFATNLLAEAAAVVLATLVGLKILHNDLPVAENDDGSLSKNIKSSILDEAQKLSKIVKQAKPSKSNNDESNISNDGGNQNPNNTNQDF